jgi:anti-sigma factor RsiW
MGLQRPDDGQFSAWLDSELEGADASSVQAWLRDHADDAARVRLWAADRDALRARLASVLDEPVPERLSQVVWRRARAGSGWRGLWLQAAMAAGLLVAGALIGADVNVSSRGVRPCRLCARGASSGRGQRA